MAILVRIGPGANDARVRLELDVRKSMNGDFNLKENILDRESYERKYIYTGSQILNNSVFKNKKIEPFSMNLIWDLLIKNKELLGVRSKQEFLHVTNIKIYKELIEKRF